MEFSGDSQYPYVPLASPSPSSLRATKRLARNGGMLDCNMVLLKKPRKTELVEKIKDDEELIMGELQRLSTICRGADNKVSMCKDLLTSLWNEVNGEFADESSIKETIVSASQCLLEKSSTIHEELVGKSTQAELRDKAIADMIESLQFEIIQQFYVANREYKLEVQVLKDGLESLRHEVVTIKAGMNRLMASMTLLTNIIQRQFCVSQSDQPTKSSFQNTKEGSLPPRSHTGTSTSLAPTKKFVSG